MFQQHYILLIMNCKKYLKKAEYQKKNWLQDIPNYLNYYHVIGDPELEIDYKFDNINKTLILKVEDDYNSLPKKVIRAYKAIYETFEFKYIFKTDDDQLLTNNKFFDIIINLINGKTKIHYGGYIVDVKENYLSQYHRIHPELPKYLPVLKTKYCNGRFYFLSKQGIDNILEKQKNIENEYLEDYAIGFNLDIDFKETILNLHTNKYFIDMELDNTEA